MFVVVLWLCRVALCSVALWWCSNRLCCVVLRGGVCCFVEIVRCCDWLSFIAVCLYCVSLQWVFVLVLVCGVVIGCLTSRFVCIVCCCSGFLCWCWCHKCSRNTYAPSVRIRFPIRVCLKRISGSLEQLSFDGSKRTCKQVRKHLTSKRKNGSTWLHTNPTQTRMPQSGRYVFPFRPI